MKNAKVYIGFIAYEENTAKYLPYFLPSLKNQTYNNIHIVCFDNSADHHNANSSYIEANFREAELTWCGGRNLGFGAAYNKMLTRAIESGAEYFLALNPDMILQADMLEKLIQYAETDRNAVAIIPKILRWDFTNQVKTRIVDSYGLVADKKLRFFDNFQGLIDKQQIKEPSPVFGFTGAAVLFNLQQLQTVKVDGQYFDERMFMYKEDCDLSIRFKLAGLQTVIVPEAIAYHDRTAAIVGRSIMQIFANRTNKGELVKRWSFKNQLIIVLKYWRFMNFSFRLSVSFQVFKMLIFILLFERFLLKELFIVFKLAKEIRNTAAKINCSISKAEFSRQFKTN